MVDAADAVIQVEDYQFAVSQMAQTSLRSIVGKSDLDDLLSNREKLNQGLELMIDSPAMGWGVQIDRVEIKDVSLPETMKRSMARQAEADRERRARVIDADAELQASKKLAEAAGVMSEQPPRSNCGCCRPWWRSPPRRTPPSCSPSRWNCCGSWNRRGGRPAPEQARPSTTQPVRGSVQQPVEQSVRESVEQSVQEQPSSLAPPVDRILKGRKPDRTRPHGLHMRHSHAVFALRTHRVRSRRVKVPGAYARCCTRVLKSTL